MLKMNRIIYLIVFVLSTLFASAQEIATSTEPAMADTFRSEGKIYVVIAVLSIIFLCLIGYLIYIDVKLRKLENSKKN